MKKIHSFTSDFKLERWGYGEWVEECDEMEFKYKNYHCKILRNFCGALCGYIKIDLHHPWFNKNYNNIDCDCHKGLTFSGQLTEKVDFWIGFDCAHFSDIIPEMQDITEKYFKIDSTILKQTYKNIDFCIEECKKIVDRAIEIEIKINKEEKS